MVQMPFTFPASLLPIRLREVAQVLRLPAVPRLHPLPAAVLHPRPLRRLLHRVFLPHHPRLREATITPTLIRLIPEPTMIRYPIRFVEVPCC